MIPTIEELINPNGSTIGQRLLIDFKRLLNKCMEMVHSSSDDNRWRLESYIYNLEERLDELRQMNILKQDQDELAEYIRSVKFLKGFIDLDKLKTPSQRLIASQILSPVPSTATTESQNKTREIGMRSKAKYSEEVREELLNSHNDANNLRKRLGLKGGKVAVDGGDERLSGETMLLQAEVAEDMIDFTKNLKEYAIKSNQVIKKDVETIESTTNDVDINSAVLKKSSDKLTEFVRRSCQLWIWIMLAVTAFIFIWMILFMRVFPKRFYPQQYTVNKELPYDDYDR